MCVIPGSLLGRALSQKDRGDGFKSCSWILLLQHVHVYALNLDSMDQQLLLSAFATHMEVWHRSDYTHFSLQRRNQNVNFRLAHS